MVLLAALSSCKKDKDTKPAVLDTHTGLLKNGSYIEGTVVTATSDNEPVEFSFNYQYLDAEFFYDGASGGSTTMGNYLYKDYTDYNDNYPDYARVRFSLDSLKDNTLSNINFSMYGSSNLPGNKVFYFDVNNTAIITDYTYDSLNHVMSGKFSMNSNNTNNGQDASITGSFRYADIQNVRFRTSK